MSRLFVLFVCTSVCRGENLEEGHFYEVSLAYLIRGFGEDTGIAVGHHHHSQVGGN